MLFVVEEIRFIRQLKDIKLTSIKVAVVFECELSKKGLKVEWSKDNKKLRRDERIDMVDEGKVHRLTIDKADLQDAGNYSASYENLTTSASLKIAGIYVSNFIDLTNGRSRKSHAVTTLL